VLKCPSVHVIILSSQTFAPVTDMFVNECVLQPMQQLNQPLPVRWLRVSSSDRCCIVF